MYLFSSFSHKLLNSFYRSTKSTTYIHTHGTSVVSSNPIPNYRKRTWCLKVNLAEKCTFYYLTMLKKIYIHPSILNISRDGTNPRRREKKKAQQKHHQVWRVTSDRGLPMFGQEIFEEYLSTKNITSIFWLL